MSAVWDDNAKIPSVPTLPGNEAMTKGGAIKQENTGTPSATLPNVVGNDSKKGARRWPKRNNMKGNAKVNMSQDESAPKGLARSQGRRDPDTSKTDQVIQGCFNPAPPATSSSNLPTTLPTRPLRDTPAQPTQTGAQLPVLRLPLHTFMSSTEVKQNSADDHEDKVTFQGRKLRNKRNNNPMSDKVNNRGYPAPHEKHRQELRNCDPPDSYAHVSVTANNMQNYRQDVPRYDPPHRRGASKTQSHPPPAIPAAGTRTDSPKVQAESNNKTVPAKATENLSSKAAEVPLYHAPPPKVQTLYHPLSPPETVVIETAASSVGEQKQACRTPPQEAPLSQSAGVGVGIKTVGTNTMIGNATSTTGNAAAPSAGIATDAHLDHSRAVHDYDGDHVIPDTTSSVVAEIGGQSSEKSPEDGASALVGGAELGSKLSHAISRLQKPFRDRDQTLSPNFPRVKAVKWPQAATEVDPNFLGSGYQLVDWQGKWAPAPVDWDIRPSYQDKHFLETVEDWRRKSEQSIEDMKVEDVPEFSAEPNGDITPRGWIPKEIELQTIYQWWANHVAASANDEYIETEPWWMKPTFAGTNLMSRLEVPDPKQNPADATYRKMRAEMSRDDTAMNPAYTMPKELMSSKDHAARFVERHTRRKRETKEDRRAMRRAVADRQANYVAPPNPHTPKANIYLRPAVESDMAQIADIYNAYIANSARSPEMKRCTVIQMTSRWRDVSQNSLPYLVAVDRSKGGRNNKGRRVVSNSESILGFAFADDFNDIGGSYRYVVEMEIWVLPSMYHQGIGKCLMDKMIHLVDQCHEERGGYLFEGEGPKYYAGGTRVVGWVVANVGFFVEEKEEMQWTGKWLEEWGFKKTGQMDGIGLKNGHFVTQCSYMRKTGARISAHAL